MGKVWLKSVDPSKQCCGCEGKSSPCDSCCYTKLYKRSVGTIVEEYLYHYRFYNGNLPASIEPRKIVITSYPNRISTNQVVFIIKAKKNQQFVCTTKAKKLTISGNQYRIVSLELLPSGVKARLEIFRSNTTTKSPDSYIHLSCNGITNFSKKIYSESLLTQGLIPFMDNNFSYLPSLSYNPSFYRHNEESYGYIECRTNQYYSNEFYPLIQNTPITGPKVVTIHRGTTYFYIDPISHMIFNYTDIEEVAPNPNEILLWFPAYVEFSGSPLDSGPFHMGHSIEKTFYQFILKESSSIEDQFDETFSFKALEATCIQAQMRCNFLESDENIVLEKINLV